MRWPWIWATFGIQTLLDEKCLGKSHDEIKYHPTFKVGRRELMEGGWELDFQLGIDASYDEWGVPVVRGVNKHASRSRNGSWVNDKLCEKQKGGEPEDPNIPSFLLMAIKVYATEESMGRLVQAEMIGVKEKSSISVWIICTVYVGALKSHTK